MGRGEAGEGNCRRHRAECSGRVSYCERVRRAWPALLQRVRRMALVAWRSPPLRWSRCGADQSLRRSAYRARHRASNVREPQNDRIRDPAYGRSNVRRPRFPQQSYGRGHDKPKQAQQDAGQSDIDRQLGERRYLANCRHRNREVRDRSDEVSLVRHRPPNTARYWLECEPKSSCFKTDESRKMSAFC